MKHYAATLVFASTFFIASSILGQEDRQTTKYVNLHGEPNRIADMTKAVATLTKNTNKLNLKVRVMPISKVGIFKNIDNVMGQNSERMDFSKIADTLALVVDYETSKEYVGLTHITGVTRVHEGIEIELHNGSMQYCAYNGIGFKNVLTVSQWDKVKGFILSGKGTLRYFWFIPALKAKYELVIPGSDNTVIGKAEIIIESK